MNSNSPEPLVYVIVLTWNMRAAVLRCLSSLGRLSYSNHRIVVVDNASHDGTETVLRESFGELDIIQTGWNAGYTGGNNLGIEYALARGADYVLILNPDTVLANPGFLEPMVSYLENNPEVGVAGPRVFLREAGMVQNTILFPPGLWKNITHWVRYRINPRFAELSGDEIIEAEVLNGVCVLIRAACLRQVGLLDDNIFMYIEDAEFDYRARRCGWRIKYLPIDSVIHEQKRESYHMTGPVSFLLKRNSVYFLHKIGKRFEAWGYAVLSLAMLLLRACSPFNRESCREHLRFAKRLARAYRCVLFNLRPDESFGPPFAQL